MTKATFQVVSPMRHGIGEFDDITDALISARERAVDCKAKMPVVSVWRDGVVCIAVVTDDGNGLTVHRLSTWPDGLECAY